MKPYIWTKQPSTTRRLEFDGVKTLILTDTIVSATAAIFDDATGVDVSASMIGTPVVVGNKIYILVRGGTDGGTYWLRLRITTTLGELIEDDLKILVKQTGK